MKLVVDTNFPIASDSPDHVYPLGTRNDNTTSQLFIDEVEKDLNNSGHYPGHVMDLGCAGGLLVHDFVRRGHLAIGLEGSNDNIQNQRYEWPHLYNQNLFTCDISREFSVLIEDEQGRKPFECDLITAWEVIEHIHPDRLAPFFENIRKHLKVDGKFVGGISLGSGPPHHQSVFSETVWKNEILNHLDGLTLKEYPYRTQNHFCYCSIYIMLCRS